MSSHTINPRWRGKPETAASVYMVERHLPGITMPALEALRQAGQRACETPTGGDAPVRYLRSTFAPGESRCLCFFQAPNADVVQEVNEVAQIPYSRIIPVIDLVTQ